LKKFSPRIAEARKAEIKVEGKMSTKSLSDDRRGFQKIYNIHNVIKFLKFFKYSPNHIFKLNSNFNTTQHSNGNPKNIFIVRAKSLATAL